MMTAIFTIGFTGTTAENFFARLQNAGVQKVVDTRRWPDTQLSGFAKRKDLGYFLNRLINVVYEYNGLLAPSEELLKASKGGGIDWPEYQRRYLALLEERKVAEKLSPASVNGAAFLCAEAQAQHCHRRLLAEYLQRSWQDAHVTITHL